VSRVPPAPSSIRDGSAGHPGQWRCPIEATSSRIADCWPRRRGVLAVSSRRSPSPVRVYPIRVIGTQ
jgi:hypothetical protein